jgi:hypothetical protein
MHIEVKLASARRCCFEGSESLRLAFKALATCYQRSLGLTGDTSKYFMPIG